MEPSVYVDTISFQIKESLWDSYSDLLMKFYKVNDLMLIPQTILTTDGKENEIHRLCQKTNLRTTISYINRNGNQYSNDTYTTFTFSGLKRYKNSKDAIRQKILNNFIQFLHTNNISFKIKKVDISFDMKVNKRKSIKHFFPIRSNKMGLRQSINSPFDYYEDTTLYVENKNIKKPSMKAYIYDKSIKENLDEKIIRFEISLRKFDNKTSEEFESFWNHINKQISKYNLYFFNDKANCDKNKRIYRNSNFKLSKTLSKSISNTKGIKVNLSLNDDLYKFFKSLFKETNIDINIPKKEYKEFSIRHKIHSYKKKKKINSTIAKQNDTQYNHIPIHSVHNISKKNKNNKFVVQSTYYYFTNFILLCIVFIKEHFINSG